MSMVERLRGIRDARWFQNGVTGTILAAGALVGLETYPGLAEPHHDLFKLLDAIVLTIFVLEIVVKMGSEWPRPLRYFQDPWNVFDFMIVAVCLLPFAGNSAAVLRLARLLRVLRLVTALPRLQVLVATLLKSIPSLGYIALLLGLLFYVYAVAGTILFGANDPVNFGSLEVSLLSLFQTVTMEDWVDLLNIQRMGCDVYGYDQLPHLCTQPTAQPLLGVAYFVSFILVGTMVVLNLFVGVIMNGMDEARREIDDAARKARGELGFEDEMLALQSDLSRVQERLAQLRIRARRTHE